MARAGVVDRPRVKHRLARLLRPRPLLAVLAVAACWAIALWLAAAWHGPGVPGPAVASRVAVAADWQVVVGSGEVRDGRLAVTRFSDAGEAFVLWRPQPFAASERPVLRVALTRFPYNYTLMLAWRRSGEPAAAFTRLQVPTGRVQTYLLSRLSQWHGTIEEIALYLYPQAGPALAVTEPIELVTAALESDAWGARIAALMTGWWGADPWNLKSVNTLGVYPDLVEGLRLTPAVFVAALIGALVTGLLWRARGWRVLAVGGAWLLAGVMVIHAHWLASLIGQRQASARALAQGRPLTPSFDRGLAQLVQAAREHLPAPPGPRVFVAADARLYELRAAWHLLPHNVFGGVPQRGGPAAAGIRAGDHVFVYRRPGLLAQAQSGRADLAGTTWPVRLLWAAGDGALIEILPDSE